MLNILYNITNYTAYKKKTIMLYVVYIWTKLNVATYVFFRYLNEIFVWWHRLPRRVNFLKNFWSNTTNERNIKNHLFAAEPPQLYAVHYLGWKPWLCYRDYDCNFDVDEQLVYASDAAHGRWWKVHDAMDESLQKFCRLTKQRRTEINWERRRARLRGSTDFHWRINVTDPRRRRSYLIG